MANIANRVRETSTTTGTGTLNLDGAVSNFQGYVDGVGAVRCPYVIAHRTLPEWEVGWGTVTDGSPDTLSRDEVEESSNADALVSFSAGTKDVFIDVSAKWIGGVLDFFNGTFLESFDALVTSDGATVTMSIEQSGGGDLTMRFSDGLTMYDCTPADTITLTHGTDTVPVENYVYIPKSTKVLTVSTTDWPSEEHIKVSFFYLKSATHVQADGALVNQNWNDHAEGTDGQGHLSHITERSRSFGVQYKSGCDLTVTATTAILRLAVSAGVIRQMHKHSFSALDMLSGDDCYIVNDPTTAFLKSTNLHDDLTQDASGGSITNRYMNLTIWGVANKGGEYSPLMVNLPTGTYATLSGAEADTSSYNVDTIPTSFSTNSSTGFLIARITVRKSGGAWVHHSTVDLRGSSTSGGGGGGGSTLTEFSDGNFLLYNASDATKTVDFDLSGITASTNRTLTVADVDGTIITTGNLTSITSVGTITSGTWQGSVIDHERGGLEADVSAYGGLIKISGGVTSSIADNSSDWNTAFGWGNHGVAGYAVSGGAEHNGFSDYVGNQHIDWTSTSENLETSGSVKATGATTEYSLINSGASTAGLYFNESGKLWSLGAFSGVFSCSYGTAGFTIDGTTGNTSFGINNVATTGTLAAGATTITGGLTATTTIQAYGSGGLVAGTADNTKGFLHLLSDAGGAGGYIQFDKGASYDSAYGTRWNFYAFNHNLIITNDGGGTPAANAVYYFTPNLGFVTDKYLNVSSDTYGLRLGAGYDAAIRYNGTDLVIDSKVVGTGVIKFAGSSNWLATSTGTTPTPGNDAPVNCSTFVWLKVKDDSGTASYIRALQL